MQGFKNISTLVMSAPLKVIMDFPSPGIRFLEITPFLLNPAEVRQAVLAMCNQIKALGSNHVAIVGPEARGFIIGSMVAYELQAPFFMLRKAGKLPNDGTQITFSAVKEYGSSDFALNEADLETLKQSGCTDVVIVDDILATGHTNCTIADFFQSKGFRVISVMNLIEIKVLNGSRLLEEAGYHTYSYLQE